MGSRALDVACPLCKAKKNEPCKVERGEGVHKERAAVYMAASKLKEALGI